MRTPALAIALSLIVAPATPYAATLTPFVSVGAYHRLCQNSYTDPMLCDVRRIGSDTPGTIDIGARFEFSGPSWAPDQIDAGLFHQSYVTRGNAPWGDYGSTETYTNMIGVRFTWEFESLRLEF